MKPLRRLMLALLMLPAASWAAEAVIDARTSVTHIYFQGGFAIAGDNGSEGSLDPVETLRPTALGFAGRNDYDGSYLDWVVEFDAAWSLAQDWSLDAAASAFSGHGATSLEVSGTVVGPFCTPCLPSMLLWGTNAQALDFTLDATSPYQFHSETTMNQWVSLYQWIEAAQRWHPLWNGPTETQGVVFDRSGELEPGRYRVQNHIGMLEVDNAELALDVAWSWTMTLPGVAVSAVPEPGGALLLGGGVAALLAWRRRLRR